jgi:hypothetical protein
MMQTSVISPELSANSFVSPSGKKYIVYPTMTTYRFEVFERMQIEMEYGVTLSAFRKEVSDTYDLLNKAKPADAAVKLYNIVSGVSRIENKQPHPLLLICTLFICEESEDQSTWNEADAAEKVADWAGVDIAFFLASAKLLFRRFTTAFDTDSLNISLETERSGIE